MCESLRIPLPQCEFFKCCGRVAAESRDVILVGNGEDFRMEDEHWIVIVCDVVVVTEIVWEVQHGVDNFRLVVMQLDRILLTLRR